MIGSAWELLSEAGWTSDPGRGFRTNKITLSDGEGYWIYVALECLMRDHEKVRGLGPNVLSDIEALRRRIEGMLGQETMRAAKDQHTVASSYAAGVTPVGRR